MGAARQEIDMVKQHQISIHEAGHAVLAVVSGLGIKGATLRDSPIVPLDHRLNRCVGDAETEIARFLLGGFCAERRFYPALCNRENSSRDFAAVLQYVPSDELWHRRLCEAELLVTRYRLAIQNVAQELLEYGSLNASRIARVVHKSSR
jgi:hypothetical protein